MTKLFLISFFLTMPTLAQQCPIGAKEDHLTIQRVMINYGKYVSDAQNLANMGANEPQTVINSEEISNAANELSVVVACANAILANPTGDLLPDEVSFLQGEERKKFIDDFLFFTEEFRDAILDFQKNLQGLTSVAPQSRDWQALYKESKDIDELVDHAHSKTSGEMIKPQLQMLQGDLHNDMKQIERDLRGIANNVKGPAQTNLTLAQDMADLFKECLDFVPDGVSDLPADQQAQAVADYRKMIQQGEDLSLSLKEALANSDTTTALNIISQLKQLKSDGHHKYNP